MSDMAVGMLFGSVLSIGGVLLGWWLARIALADRDAMEQALGAAIAEQQQEIMRLRSGDASAGELGRDVKLYQCPDGAWRGME